MSCPAEHLLIFGASARAAASSALRAGLRPWCADLFGDADLRAQCAATVLGPGRYPAGFLDVLRQAPPGPWLYTGGLENRPKLVRRMAALRPLWGNGPDVLKVVRDPAAVARLCAAAGLPCPAVRLHAADLPAAVRWLAKPFAGAGGAHVGFWTGLHDPGRRAVYFQEFIAGDDVSAVYVGDGRRAHLLGLTRQLVGESWLHAAPFHYGGSVGPLDPEPSLRPALERLGDVLTAGSGLRGLFGIDCVLRQGVPWPVEINPRYTASVEVLEHGHGVRALALHRRAFDAAAPEPEPRPAAGIVGKGVLFTPRPLVFPADGPWQEALARPVPVDQLPAFADIPAPGTAFAAGRPVLSFCTRGRTVADCLDELRRRAADLDRALGLP